MMMYFQVHVAILYKANNTLQTIWPYIHANHTLRALFLKLVPMTKYRLPSGAHATILYIQETGGKECLK